MKNYLNIKYAFLNRVNNDSIGKQSYKLVQNHVVKYDCVVKVIPSGRQPWEKTERWLRIAKATIRIKVFIIAGF